MDALALLCNLHADGPNTLARLRRSGCNSIDELVSTPPERLAAAFGGSVEDVGRFQREGQRLAARLAPPVEEAPAKSARTARVDPIRPMQAVRAYGAAEPSADADVEVTFEPHARPADAPRQEPAEPAIAGERDAPGTSAPSGMTRVLDLWRELDESTPMPDAASDAAGERAASDEARAPRLRDLALDGLDRALELRLAELGLASAADFVEADPLDLSRAIPLAFTRVKHLQFLAQRALDGGEDRAVLAPRPAPAPPMAAPMAPRADASASATPRGEVDPARLDAAGPFA